MVYVDKIVKYQPPRIEISKPKEDEPKKVKSEKAEKTDKK